MSKTLHNLIRSMDKSEKRHLRLFVQQNYRQGRHKSMELYDFLLKMEAYEEDLLLQAHSKGRLPKDLPAARYKLADLILKSLRAYHAAGSTSNLLKSELENIKILFDKELLALCDKKIRSLKAKAAQLEDHRILVELLDWESRVIYFLQPPHLLEKMSEITLAKSKALAVLSEEQELLSLFRKMHLATKKQLTHLSPEEKEYMEEIGGSPLLKSPEAPASQLGKACKNLSLGLYDFVLGNVEEAHPRLLAAYQIFAGNSYLVALFPEIYRVAATNLLNNSLLATKVDVFELVLKDLRKKLSDSNGQDKLLKQTALRLELVYCMNFGEEERGGLLVEEISDFVARNIDWIEPSGLLNFLYNCSIFHFMYGHAQAALKHLQGILNLRREDIRHDILEFATLFQLAIHYELGNMDFLEYQVRNAKRFLITRNVKRDYEWRILAFFQRAIQLVSQPEQLGALQDLKGFLEQVLAEGKERPLGCQELVFWAESKIQRKPIGEYFREQVKSRGH